MPIHHPPPKPFREPLAVHPRIRRPFRWRWILSGSNRLNLCEPYPGLPLPLQPHSLRRKSTPRRLTRTSRVINTTQVTQHSRKLPAPRFRLALSDHLCRHPRQIAAPCRRTVLISHHTQRLALPRQLQDRQQKILPSRSIHPTRPKDHVPSATLS